MGDMAGVGTIVGEELGVKEVPDTPKVDVVGKGIGSPRRTDGAYDACVLSATGHADEAFREAVPVVVELPCLAVHGDEERHLARVVDVTEIADIDFRQPYFVLYHPKEVYLIPV